MRPNKSIIKKAIELSARAQHRHHHAAIIYNKGYMLALGVNNAFRYSRRLHDEVAYRNLYYFGSLHAEAAAVLNTMNYQYVDAEMLVVRVNKAKQLMNSCPCAGCMELLAYCKLKRVWYYHNNLLVNTTLKYPSS